MTASAIRWGCWGAPEVDAMIVQPSSLRNLLRCMNRAGINVSGMVLRAWPCRVSLSADEKSSAFSG